MWISEARIFTASRSKALTKRMIGASSLPASSMRSMASRSPSSSSSDCSCCTASWARPVARSYARLMASVTTSGSAITGEMRAPSSSATSSSASVKSGLATAVITESPSLPIGNRVLCLANAIGMACTNSSGICSTWMLSMSGISSWIPRARATSFTVARLSDTSSCPSRSSGLAAWASSARLTSSSVQTPSATRISPIGRPDRRSKPASRAERRSSTVLSRSTSSLMAHRSPPAGEPPSAAARPPSAAAG